MRQICVLLFLALLILAGCQTNHRNSSQHLPNMNKPQSYNRSTTHQAQNQAVDLSCSLTPTALQSRREVILQKMKDQLVVREKLQNGYAFKFLGDDETLDWLTEFIKTERSCCPFFVFGLSISGDKREIWLELTGPIGAKEMISSELQLK